MLPKSRKRTSEVNQSSNKRAKLYSGSAVTVPPQPRHVRGMIMSGRMHLFFIFCPNASTLIADVATTSSDIDTAVQADEISVDDDLERTASTEEDLATDHAVTTTIDENAAVPLNVATAVQADESLDAVDDDLERTASTEEDLATDHAVTTTIDETAAVPWDVATAVQADESLDNAAVDNDLIWQRQFTAADFRFPDLFDAAGRRGVRLFDNDLITPRHFFAGDFESPYFFDAAGRRGVRLFEAFRLHQIEVRRLKLIPKENRDPIRTLRNIDPIDLEAKHDKKVADIQAGRINPEQSNYQETFEYISKDYKQHYAKYQQHLAAKRAQRFRLENLKPSKKNKKSRNRLSATDCEDYYRHFSCHVRYEAVYNAELSTGSESQNIVPLFLQSDAEPAATVAQGMFIFYLHCLQFLTKYIRQLLD